jgi:cell division protein ZapE
LISLSALIASLPARPDPAALVAGFVPPPRFAAKRFADYRPDPQHPSQQAALARLRGVAGELREGAGGGWLRRLRRAPAGGGVYLDGGFGVGKTHLLAALWHEAGVPAAYLSFDELVYTIGLLGVEGARAAFAGLRLVAVDEWELDDPGNLKLALAFLRGSLADGMRIATTSNTVPDQLGGGRFDQKNFRAEIEELAGAFEVLEVSGEDYRHRRYQAGSDREWFLSAEVLEQAVAGAPAGAVHADFGELLHALGEVHPIRYVALAGAIEALLVSAARPVASMYDALRWVHLVDKLYDRSVPLAMSASCGLGELFPAPFLAGAYGKKFSRCLSRLEEMLGEAAASA